MSKRRELGPLAELHVHLGGCIDHATCLQMLLDCPDARWDWYETAFERAYGFSSNARNVVERVRCGDKAARTDFKELFEFRDGDGGRFDKFQAKFNLIIVGSAAFKCLEDGRPIEEALDFLRPVIASIHSEQQRQKLAHVETRLYLGDTPRERAEAFLIGVLEAYRAQSGTPTTQLILSLERSDPLRLWPVVESLALSPLGTHLVGVDFCHVEEGFPPKSMKDFFTVFRTFNQTHPERALSLVYHVGESFDDKSIESAIRWVVEAAQAGAHRLGHAIALGIHPDHFGPHQRSESVSERRDQLAYELRNIEGLIAHGVVVTAERIKRELDELAGRDGEERLEVVYDQHRLEELVLRQKFAAQQILATEAIIEVCPSSNRRIAGLRNNAYHPIHRFEEWGLPFVIASDDPGLFGVTLADELELAAEILGWSFTQLEVAVERAWMHRSIAVTGRCALEAT